MGAVDYDLGPSAFEQPWFHGYADQGTGFLDPSVNAPLELTATVRYPIDQSRTRHPLVEIQHGQWYTCADRSVDAAITQANAELAKLPPTRDVGGMKSPPDPRAAPWQEVLARDVPRISGWPCLNGVPPLPSYRGYDYLANYSASWGFIVISISQNGANAGDIVTADRARTAVANKHL